MLVENLEGYIFLEWQGQEIADQQSKHREIVFFSDLTLGFLAKCSSRCAYQMPANSCRYGRAWRSFDKTNFEGSRYHQHLRLLVLADAELVVVVLLAA